MHNGANASLALMSNFLRRKKRDTSMDQKDRDIYMDFVHLKIVAVTPYT